ncbi:NAD(P)/FAD-dependent oxidoreductase [Candidatus Micrarchaeota archaeon]|nr:NAD(P)/FAD-dependent oxidoreductase [Candidatus Micrarchaeota archaeon]
MDNNYDIHVVGAGPAGLSYSLAALRDGKSVLMSDVKERPWENIACSGLITLNGYKSIKSIFPEISKTIMNRYDRISLVNGINNLANPETWIDIKLKNSMVRIDRALFGRLMFEKAVSYSLSYSDMKESSHGSSYAGSNNPDFSGSDSDIDYDYVSGSGSGRFEFEVKRIQNIGDIKSKIVLGADGPISSIADIFGFKRMNNYVHTNYIDAICKDNSKEVRKTNIDNLEDRLLVIRDETLFKGFFAWVIPDGNGSIRNGSVGERKGLQIGMGALLGTDVKYPFNMLINRLSAVYGFDRLKIKNKMSALIPIRLRQERFKRVDGYEVMLIGDSAGHVKSITGGGVYYGFMIGYYMAHGDVDKVISLENELKMLSIARVGLFGMHGIGYDMFHSIMKRTKADCLLSMMETDSVKDTLLNIIHG